MSYLEHKKELPPEYQDHEIIGTFGMTDKWLKLWKENSYVIYDRINKKTITTVNRYDKI